MVRLFNAVAPYQLIRRCKKHSDLPVRWRAVAGWLLFFSSAPMVAESIIIVNAEEVEQKELAAELKPAADVEPPSATSEAESDDLLAMGSLEQWSVFNSDATTPATTVWRLLKDESGESHVLVCMGEPKGFLFTKQQYNDFELTLEWKYPKDADGNSGILVYTQNESRIWPTSVQVQLHQPKAGSIFPSGDATTDNTRDSDPDLARPVNTWNSCRIVSQEGRLTVEVNDKKAGEVSGAKPAVGSIALQSEGSEVHFRKIRIRRLKGAPGQAAASSARAVKLDDSPQSP